MIEGPFTYADLQLFIFWAILRGGLWLLKRSHFSKSISFIIQVLFSPAYSTIFKCLVLITKGDYLEVKPESNLLFSKKHPKCEFVASAWRRGRDGQAHRRERREAVPLMICRSSRLIAHTPLWICLYTYLFISLFNMSANGIKKHVAGGLCNLENKSIKFINLIIAIIMNKKYCSIRGEHTVGCFTFTRNHLGVQ